MFSKLFRKSHMKLDYLAIVTNNNIAVLLVQTKKRTKTII